MSELKPCPFCGGEAKVQHQSRELYGDVVDWYGVYCKKQFCGFVSGQSTEAEAIAAWNSRAPIEYDGWFYLPKPKEGIVDYGEPEITRTENGYKVWQTVDVVDEAARRWSDELGDYVMKRICEAWNTRADDYRQAAEYWQRMYEEAFAERTCKREKHGTKMDGSPKLRCSLCGYGIGDKRWNYCPNCGAKVVSE